MRMIVFFFCGLLVPPIWLSVHIIRNKSLSWFTKFFIIFWLFVFSQIYTIDMFLFDSISGPEMPSWLLLGQAVALVTLLLSFILVFCRDIVCFIYSCLQKIKSFGSKKDRNNIQDDTRNSKENAESKKQGKVEAAGDIQDFEDVRVQNPKRRAFLKKAASACLFTAGSGLSLGTSAYGVSQAIEDPIVNHLQVSLPNLPASLDGLRIVHLSDIHIATLATKNWLRTIVDKVNAEQPDLICITGDFADGLPIYVSPDGLRRQDVAECLGALSAPLGVWACTGNHEYYSDYRGWMDIFTGLGIYFLHDKAQVLPFKGANLVLAGRNDKQANLILREPYVCMADIMSGMPNKNAFRIVLDHRPDRAYENANSGCALQLSGHTHGGQCLGMDRLVAMANKGFVRGWYKIGDMSLYVNNGAGLWNGFPVRIGVPAEIACIKVKGV